MSLLNLVCCFREKKREKERDELWRRLGELEISYKNANNVGSTSNSNTNAENSVVSSSGALSSTSS